MSYSEKVTIPEPLQKVFDLLPKPTCPKIYIAGGAAVDFDKASDVDLWFPNNAEQPARDFFNSISPYWYKRQFEVSSDASEEYTGMKSAAWTQVIGEFFHPELMKFVQVISTKWEASERVSIFDISTHMVAYTAGGLRITTPSTTPPDLPPVICSSRKNTAKRYLKICQRYGHKPDIEQLMWAVEEWSCAE